MDGALLTAILIITVIAIAEGVSLFAECIFKNRRENYFAVIPVVPGDDTLRERISDVLEQTDADIILLDCGAGIILRIFVKDSALIMKMPFFLLRKN